MFRSIFTLMAALLLCLPAVRAQVTSEPSPLMEDSQGVAVFFHADQGNKGLAGQPASAQIYAHTGVITSTSTSDSDWQYAPQWGDNAAKYKLEYVSPNLWKLNIGSIREYYGITDPSVIVKKLAFVFRTADNKKEGKAEGNKDIFLNVYQPGAHIELSSSASSAFVPKGEDVQFTAKATVAGKIEILVNGSAVASKENATELTYTVSTQDDAWTCSARLTAGDGATAESEALSFRALVPSPQAAYPGGSPVMGAVRDGRSVVFCIAAPQKQSAYLICSADGYEIASARLMNYCENGGQRYFWTRMDNTDPASDLIYYYNIDGRYNVGDPYARLVLDPQNDRYIAPDVFPMLPAYPSDKVREVALAVLPAASSEWADGNFKWNMADFKGADRTDLRIYELLLRDFTGTEGEARGNGTVRQAIDRIPYLRELGVNAVELLPINEFNGNISWGYNPNFYFAPDKAYGTPADYKEFIDKCHEAGMAVILDMVFNQADWQHPWYQMYETGQNPFFNATAPHAYSVLNDWNQGNPLVQKQWEDVLKYWLEEYNVDGFRFDLVKGLGDNSSYANAGDAATNAFNQSRIDRMQALQKVVDSVKPGAYFINENLATAPEENAMAAFGQLNWANINDPGCQYAMGYSSNSNLNRMYAPSDSRTWGSTVSYLESHDEQRLAYKQAQWGVAGVKGNLETSMLRLGSCAAQMILAPGSHMIWQFSEMGNDQNTKNSDGGNNTDPKTVCWSLLDQPERKHLVDTYRNLHRIRAGFPELFSQAASYEAKCSAADWANGRYMISRHGDMELYTVLNPNVSGTLAVNVDFTHKDNSQYSIVMQSVGQNASFDAAAGIVNVPDNSFVVIGKGDFSGVDTSDAAIGSAATVYGTDGAVVVISDTPATVYSLSGAVVAADTATGRRELPAAPGIYIVRTAAISTKVLVR